MKHVIRRVCAAALGLVAVTLASQAFAAELTLSRDGWTSWEVAAIDDAPAWCRFSSRDSGKAGEPCQLDGSSGGYGNRNGETTGSIRVYARLADGEIERLRALSATCPVQANAEIEDLGTVAADDSARWLAAVVKQGEHDAGVGHDVLSALAIHDGEVARDALIDVARHDARFEYRKEAVFLLAHLRGREGADIATFMMFNDPDADTRAHAAFAVSQSSSPQAATYLIKLANSDTDANVRAHAWFALSQTGATEAEEAITASLQKETDRQVRDQAIFALSQLPAERATRALIAVVENESLPREDRKRAVFWLSQSKSSAAQAYLDGIIATLVH